MLRSLKLDNWKSFGEGENARNEVKFGPLTVFVGPNGSGKSNALDAVRWRSPRSSSGEWSRQTR